MDAIQLLRQQHADIQSLFEQLRTLEDEEEWAGCFGELADRLAAHGEMEERLFYPSVRLRATDLLLRQAVEEHLEARELLAELLEEEGLDEEERRERLEQLELSVMAHVEAEERELLPRVRGLFTRAELDAMGEEMEELFLSLLEMEPRFEAASNLGRPAALD